jgi:paraquat-inducible protein B
MSKKADPKLIGAFVVGALALVVVGLVVFGAGQFFTTTRPFVMFFEGSVGGLQVGAPVNFRGVRLGQVTDIRLSYNPKDRTLLIPVYAEVEPDRIAGLTGHERRTAQQLADMGLRAQLGMQSFVTGQLSVELDFRPDTPARLLGLETNYEEVPTLPSDMAQLKASATRLAEQLGEIPLGQIVSDVTAAVTAARETIGTMQVAVGTVASQVGPIAENIGLATRDLRMTAEAARARLSMEDGEVLYTANVALTEAVALLRRIDSQVEPLSSDARKAMQSASRAMENARIALTGARTVIGPDSPAVFQLNTTLQEIRAAATSIRELADYLERNPNALITGKQ